MNAVRSRVGDLHYELEKTKARRAKVIWWPWRTHPTMYIPAHRFDSDDWISRTVAHEIIHVDQWKKLGRSRFVWRYLTDVIVAVVASVLLAGVFALAGAPFWVGPLLGAGVALLPRLKRGRLEIEAEAFAASARWWFARGARYVKVRSETAGKLVDAIPVLDHYARALQRGYFLWGISRSDCRARILRSYRAWWGLPPDD